MGTTSPHGLPYPEGSDLVIGGDDAIQALAEAVNARLSALHVNDGAIIHVADAGIDVGSGASWTAQFPGFHAKMDGFSYTAGALTRVGSTRFFMVAAEVEVEVNAPGGASAMSSSVQLYVGGNGPFAGAFDNLDSTTNDIVRRSVIHRVVMPIPLAHGDYITLVASASHAYSIQNTRLSVIPIGVPL